jgi:ABC-type polysaccharide/polyol phosphate export permease
LPAEWLWVAEALPLLHPVRLARAAFHGEATPILLWDTFYMIGVSALLLAWARLGVRRRLTN